MKQIAIAAIAVLAALNGVAQTGIGKWRDCLDYSMVPHLTASAEGVYAAGSGGLFYVDADDNSTYTLSKSTGLSDVGIAALEYDPTTASLVVAYTNSNIDIVRGGKVYNLSDIKRSELAADKSIYQIRFHGGMAYLCCGFGVVVVDMERHEIKETLYLGEEGSYMAVYDLSFGTDSIFAATAAGLKRASTAEPNLAIGERWTADTRIGGLRPMHLALYEGRLIVAAFGISPEGYAIMALAAEGIDTIAKGMVRSMRAGNGYMAVAYEDSIVMYGSGLSPLWQWATADVYDAWPRANGGAWCGHAWMGLALVEEGIPIWSYVPQGPFNQDNVYALRPAGQGMMVCPGGHDMTYTNMYNPPNLLTEQGGVWHSLDLSNGAFSGMLDLLDARRNPYDTTETVAALYGFGVASIRDGRVADFYSEATTGGVLSPYVSSTYTTLRTSAVEFDAEGNMWVLTSLSAHPLVKRDANGRWQAASLSSYLSAPEVDKILYDSITGYIWFYGRDNALYVYDRAGRFAVVNPNHGSKMSTISVSALVQDHDGNLWLGTNKGLKVIYDGYKAFNNGGAGEEAPVNCSNIIISNDAFSEYLMAYESITAIAVDGANRKWVGTSAGGLYLLSSSGLQQIEHFTETNSPLFSNKINAIGIHPTTGEVYVGTDRGLQVYRGTATYATAEPRTDIHAYPNPVRPDYDGPIAIAGFTRNAIVHITDAAGHTVFTTTANGGQAIWNGRTQEGKRVASGVYYVFASDSVGGNRSVAKILVIR